MQKTRSFFFALAALACAAATVPAQADSPYRDPFPNTIFVIKNPGQPGFVKRGGEGGGITDKGRDSKGGLTGGLGRGHNGRGGLAGRQ